MCEELSQRNVVIREEGSYLEEGFGGELRFGSEKKLVSFRQGYRMAYTRKCRS
jgi:hypothetical protein